MFKSIHSAQHQRSDSGSDTASLTSSPTTARSSSTESPSGVKGPILAAHELLSLQKTGFNRTGFFLLAQYAVEYDQPDWLSILLGPRNKSDAENAADFLIKKGIVDHYVSRAVYSAINSYLEKCISQLKDLSYTPNSSKIEKYFKELQQEQEEPQLLDKIYGVWHINIEDKQHIGEERTPEAWTKISQKIKDFLTTIRPRLPVFSTKEFISHNNKTLSTSPRSSYMSDFIQKSNDFIETIETLKQELEEESINNELATQSLVTETISSELQSLESRGHQKVVHIEELESRDAAISMMPQQWQTNKDWRMELANANLDLLLNYDSNGRNLLHRAILAGHKSCVQAILSLAHDGALGYTPEELIYKTVIEGVNALNFIINKQDRELFDICLAYITNEAKALAERAYYQQMFPQYAKQEQLTELMDCRPEERALVFYKKTNSGSKIAPGIITSILDIEGPIKQELAEVDMRLIDIELTQLTYTAIDKLIIQFKQLIQRSFRQGGAFAVLDNLVKKEQMEPISKSVYAQINSDYHELCSANAQLKPYAQGKTAEAVLNSLHKKIKACYSHQLTICLAKIRATILGHDNHKISSQQVNEIFNILTALQNSNDQQKEELGNLSLQLTTLQQTLQRKLPNDRLPADEKIELAPINYQDSEGNTLLHLALAQEDWIITLFLIPFIGKDLFTPHAISGKLPIQYFNFNDTISGLKLEAILSLFEKMIETIQTQILLKQSPNSDISDVLKDIIENIKGYSDNFKDKLQQSPFKSRISGVSKEARLSNLADALYALHWSVEQDDAIIAKEVFTAVTNSMKKGFTNGSELAKRLHAAIESTKPFSTIHYYKQQQTKVSFERLLPSWYQLKPIADAIKELEQEQHDTLTATPKTKPLGTAKPQEKIIEKNIAEPRTPATIKHDTNMTSKTSLSETPVTKEPKAILEKHEAINTASALPNANRDGSRNIDSRRALFEDQGTLTINTPQKHVMANSPSEEKRTPSGSISSKIAMFNAAPLTSPNDKKLPTPISNKNANLEPLATNMQRNTTSPMISGVFSPNSKLSSPFQDSSHGDQLLKPSEIKKLEYRK